jgi:DNA-binding transcriptional MerR regulator
MTVPRTYKVADVARLSGVSIRALHHYDAIGLLVPTGRTEAGYRLYNDADLLRLQQILIQRELGFPLEEIKRALDDPRFDQRQALVEQRRRLEEKAHALGAMLRAVDAALAVVGHDPEGDTMEMKELFGGFDPSQYEAEVEQRWGGPALDESKRRVKGYTGADWKRQPAIRANAAR